MTPEEALGLYTDLMVGPQMPRNRMNALYAETCKISTTPKRCVCGAEKIKSTVSDKVMLTLVVNFMAVGYIPKEPVGKPSDGRTPTDRDLELGIQQLEKILATCPK